MGVPTPPEGGCTVEDLYRLPDLPDHTELIDGSLVFRSPQSIFHSRMVSRVRRRLRDLATPELWIAREMTMVIDDQNAPEPDVMVVDAKAVLGLDQTQFQVEDVVLAVEVVSPSSATRDRDTKPHKYARAGIPHFWRVEQEHDLPVVYVYERDPTSRSYIPSGVFRGRLKVGVPFPVDLDLDLTTVSGS